MRAFSFAKPSVRLDFALFFSVADWKASAVQWNAYRSRCMCGVRVYGLDFLSPLLSPDPLNFWA